MPEKGKIFPSPFVESVFCVKQGAKETRTKQEQKIKNKVQKEPRKKQNNKEQKAENNRSHIEQSLKKWPAINITDHYALTIITNHTG